METRRLLVIILLFGVVLSESIFDNVEQVQIDNGVVKAAERLSKDKIIVEYDTSSCLCIPSSLPLIELAEKTLGKKLWVDQKAYIILLVAKNNPDVLPEWHSWIATLPKTFNTPLFWGKEALRQLQGTQLYDTIKQVKSVAKEDSVEIFQRLSELEPEQFPKEYFGSREILWAKHVWKTRLVPLNDPASVCFHPIIEYFDYFKKTNVVVHYTTDDHIQLVTKYNIPKFEPLTISDGYNFTQAELLDYYGKLHENVESSVVVGVQLDSSESDKLYSWKRGLLATRNLNNGQYYSLAENHIPVDLLYAMRVFFLTIYESDDIQNLHENKMVSVQNDISVYQAILNTCKHKLDQFITTIHEDEILLQNEDDMDDIRRVCVRYRLGEKRVLSSIIELSEQQLASLKLSYDTRSFDIPNVIQ